MIDISDEDSDDEAPLAIPLYSNADGIPLFTQQFLRIKHSFAYLVYS
jgi:hypothetical protein